MDLLYVVPWVEEFLAAADVHALVQTCDKMEARYTVDSEWLFVCKWLHFVTSDEYGCGNDEDDSLTEQYSEDWLEAVRKHVDMDGDEVDRLTTVVDGGVGAFTYFLSNLEAEVRDANKMSITCWSSFLDDAALRFVNRDDSMSDTSMSGCEDHE